MRITYIANIRMPTEKAHGVQIMKTCEAFARAGHEVTLVVPRRRNPIAEDPFVYYGVGTRFKIKYLPVIDTVSWGRLGFVIESLSFACVAACVVTNNTIVYGRDELVLALCQLRGARTTVWETHTGAWNSAARYVARRAQGVVCITEGLKKIYVERGVLPQRMLVAHDGVDLASFAHPESKEAARRRLGLPQDKKIALYIGRLDGWKGVNTLCEAASLLPDDVCAALIGGEVSQVELYKKKYPHVLFLGFRPYRELADNQAAGDVLVLPNTGKDIVSVAFTSPLKLFAYMASGVPIVASDLPSIREVLSDGEAYLVQPDAAAALAEGIKCALTDTGANLKAAAAHRLVERYDWQARAQKILAFILAQKA